ncbi:MAG: hypothetical protein H7222_10130, partial [Methylotenera sp.]|nr:hypothetical protein [Oligoflexia bacterium]
LWHLREELSRSGKVVYAKWYRGRATFFSKKLFTSALRVLSSGLEERILKRDLSRAAQTVLEILQSDSPLSGKMIRKLSELTGKDNEKIYTQALKQLWDRLLIVGHGEIDDGAFPSLALGATSVVFERLWSDSLKVSEVEAWSFLERKLGLHSAFFLYLQKQARLIRQKAVVEAAHGLSPEQLG